MDTNIYFDKYAQYWEAETSAIFESYDDENVLEDTFFVESGTKESLGKRIMKQIQAIFEKCRDGIQKMIAKITGKVFVPAEVRNKKVKLTKQNKKINTKYIDAIKNAKTMEELERIEKSMTVEKVVKTGAVVVGIGALCAGAAGLLKSISKETAQTQKQVQAGVDKVEKDAAKAADATGSESTPVTKKKFSLFSKFSSIVTRKQNEAASEVANTQKTLGARFKKAASNVAYTAKKPIYKHEAKKNLNDKELAKQMFDGRMAVSVLSESGEDSALIGNYLVYLEDAEDPDSIVMKKISDSDFEESAVDDDFLDLDYFVESSEDDDLDGYVEDTDDELDALIASL